MSAAVESLLPAIRTIVVTGATAGIGLATTRRLVDLGHRVIAVGRRRDRLDALAAISPAGKVWTLDGDVRDRSRLETLLEDIPPAFANIDGLVNNAGLLVGAASYDELDANALNTMVQTNCIGLTNMTSLLLNKLQRSGQGHIINISSIGAVHPYVGGHVYAATKAFVEQFGACLRTELVAKKIKLTTIRPGRTETEFSLVRFNGDQERAAAAYNGITPLQAGDVAEAVIWAFQQPQHVNINLIELMPADQQFSFK